MLRTTLICLVFAVYCFLSVSCQEYLVPVYVKADEYGTAHFKLPEPKTGPPKSSFHIEQLIKLESELLGLGEIILETEKKLHAKKKVSATKDAAKDADVKHKHNYTGEMTFLDEVTILNENIHTNLKKYVSNPLAMFPVKKRLADKWPYIMDNITECSMVAEYTAINDHFQHVNRRLKQDGDLELAYQDLLRLQKTYKLPVSSLARGWIQNEVTDPLGLTDIIAIANICLDREDLEGTLEWLLQVAKFLKTMGLKGAEKTKYMNILGGAYLRLDRLQEAKLVYGQLLKEDPKSRIATANMQLIEERMKEEAKKEEKAKETASKESKKKGTKSTKFGKKASQGVKEEKKEAVYKEEWWMRFCRGDFDPDWDRERFLKCYVKDIPISGMKYQIEPLSINPPIYLIRNVLQNFTMSKLVEVASKELSEKIHSYSQPEEPSVPVYENEEHYWMDKLAVTMQNLTYQKYRVDSHSEFNLLGAVRVYNVGAGGTSNPGKGELRVNPHQGWERNFIGRYMMFLTAPKAGGHFAFPWAKVRVTPERGDVLFWQFRTPTGYVNPRVFHWLECPVVLGDFWYAEQMVEHHNMIDKVDFEFNPDQFFIPEAPPTKTTKSKKSKKKVLKKKKKVVKEEVEEEETAEEEEQVDEVEESEEEQEVAEEEEVTEEQEVGDEEEEVAEEEEVEKPVASKKIKKKVKKVKKATKEDEVSKKKEPTKSGKKAEEDEEASPSPAKKADDVEEVKASPPPAKKKVKKTIKKKKTSASKKK